MAYTPSNLAIGLTKGRGGKAPRTTDIDLPSAGERDPRLTVRDDAARREQPRSLSENARVRRSLTGGRR